LAKIQSAIGNWQLAIGDVVMETLFKDIRYGIRSLLKRPAFTAIAVITLALGIGANTAIFSVVNAVLLRPLPYMKPDRIVALWETEERGDLSLVSPGDYTDWVEQNHSFENIAAVRDWDANLNSFDEPVRLQGAAVSSNAFSVLGVQPLLGRTFLPDEDQAGRDLVVVLSHGIWQRYFGGDPKVIEKTVTINGRARRVVGVMPASFQLPILTPHKPASATDIWVPFVMDPTYRTKRDVQQLHVMGRLKSGVSPQQAQAEVSAINQRSGQHFESSGRPIEARVVPFHQSLVGNLRPMLFLLLGAVGFVLLIACGNVANLLLARATTRKKEFAIRAALGAGRLRLVREMLTESVLLAILGGATGLLIAMWITQALVAVSPEDLPRLKEIALDRWVLGFTLAVSLLTGAIFGLAPAWKLSRQDLNETLKEGGRGSGSDVPRQRMRRLLVISELALAMVLLIGAGLMIQSVARLNKVDAGFQPENVLAMELSLPSKTYEQASQRTDFFQRLIERVRSVPGVQTAGVVTAIPLTGWQNTTSFEMEGRAQMSQTEELHAASADYFEVLGIPLIKGRYFTDQDNKQAPGAVIVSRSLAQRYWPNEDPLGKRIRLGGDKQEPWRSIVGVVGDIRQSGLDGEATREYYISYLQDNWGFTWDMNLVVHTTTEPATTVGAIKNEVRAVDKNLPVFNVRTMDDLRARSVAPRRFNMFLLGSFALVAMVMSVLGIYGVMSYSVAQRTHEIGVRMALGAAPGNVLRLIIRNGMTLALSGVAIGVVGAFALTRLMTSLLFGVTPTDTMTFATVSAGLIVVALIACFIPARRATKVDPLVALRYE
jgi:predicted permease